MKEVKSDYQRELNHFHIVNPTAEDIERSDYFAELDVEKTMSKPKLVFKYKSVSSDIDLDRLCDIIKNNRIYMPLLKDLNDPLESANSYLDGISEEDREEYFKDYRVLALSADPFLPTLWAYYADNYKGVCLGFWSNHNFSAIKEVVYHKSQERIVWEIDSSDLYKKGEAWKHEAEYRIVRKDKDNTYLKFEQEDLACVIFGCNIDSEVRGHIETLVPANISILSIKCDKSKFSLYAEKEKKLYTIEELIECINNMSKKNL